MSRSSNPSGEGSAFYVVGIFVLAVALIALSLYGGSAPAQDVRPTLKVNGSAMMVLGGGAAPAKAAAAPLPTVIHP